MGWSHGMQMRLLVIRYIIVTFAAALCCWRECQPSCVSMCVHYEARCFTLDKLQFLYVILCEWVPDRACILHYWAHECVVAWHRGNLAGCIGGIPMIIVMLSMWPHQDIVFKITNPRYFPDAGSIG